MVKSTLTVVGPLRHYRGQRILADGESLRVLSHHGTDLAVTRWRWYHTLMAQPRRAWRRARWLTVAAALAAGFAGGWLYASSAAPGVQVFTGAVPARVISVPCAFNISGDPNDLLGEYGYEQAMVSGAAAIPVLMERPVIPWGGPGLPALGACRTQAPAG